MTSLAQSLTLPCGQVVPNRILKSAMSECLGTPKHAPSAGLEVLYSRWAAGGTGLLITGNVMVDRRALGEPGNVVLEDDRDLAWFSRWAQAATANGTQCWMQLNHPGKQSPKFLSSTTVSPSAVGFGPAMAKAFAVPRALTEPEIEDLIARFGRSAGLAKRAGFTGVQIHGAHGYLVSQFLSPHHNRREDRWGGSLENRARFGLAIYDAVRDAVGPGFPVSIKLNSADFQRGGLSEEDSVLVMEMLQDRGIDLVEVSGGTYEAPAMTGQRQRASTREREGYFMDFVVRARKTLTVPMCITGGFRSCAGMEGALGDGADMVGLARTLAIQPSFSAQVLAGEDPKSLVRRLSTGLKGVDRIAALDVTWYEAQLARMGAGKEPAPDLGAWSSLLSTVSRTGIQAFKMRRAK